MLKAEALSKTFSTRAGELPVLREVSLELGPGESAVVLGPSGSGKSTLLNILGTLDPPNSGRVLLGDCDPYALSPRELARFRNRQVGFVFQDHHLLPHCSVLENVLVPTLAGGGHTDAAGRARGLLERAGGASASRRYDAAGRAHGLLEQVGLSDRLDHLPAELSGGEKQRVALARALINQPRLLLADEPTGNLDRATAKRVGDLLVELPRERATVLVVVTHSETLAARFDRGYELVEGTLTERARSGRAPHRPKM